MNGQRRDKQKLVSLIGMPSAGKTKVGALLAERLECGFVDIDDCITRHFSAKNLQEVVDRLSSAEFAAAEESVAILTLENLFAPTIIATGGSMVYSENAMGCFDQKTHIIHLRASLKTSERRVAQRPDRGIVFAPGETLSDLYARRMPLYAQWAHRTVAINHDRSKVAERLAAQLRRENLI